MPIPLQDGCVVDFCLPSVKIELLENTVSLCKKTSMKCLNPWELMPKGLCFRSGTNPQYFKATSVCL